MTLSCIVKSAPLLNKNKRISKRPVIEAQRRAVRPIYKINYQKEKKERENVRKKERKKKNFISIIDINLFFFY